MPPKSRAEPAAPEPVQPADAAFGRGRYALWGVAAALVLSIWAGPAGAVEHTLVRWKKTGQCEILTQLPMWGDHWVVLGTFPSKMQAEQELSKLRRTKACPASKSAKRAEKPPEQRKTAPTKPANRPVDMLW